MNFLRIPKALRFLGKFSVRQGLMAAGGILVFFVSACILAVVFSNTERLAEEQAAIRMEAASTEARAQLQSFFDPIIKDIGTACVGISLQGLPANDAKLLKDHLVAPLYSLDQVGSLMVADTEGWQFLVMRYDESVLKSPLLRGVIPSLPQPSSSLRQFFTREFSIKKGGTPSHWTLWSADGVTVQREWDIRLPDYDPRKRPWFEAGMKSLALLRRQAPGRSLPPVFWTPVNTLFTTRMPGISAVAAVIDPKGHPWLVVYDLLLDDVARLTRSAAPTKNGSLMIVTAEGDLIGPPRNGGGDTSRYPVSGPLRRLDSGDAPLANAVFSYWKDNHLGSEALFSLVFEGSTWWATIKRFEVGNGQSFWIGVMIPSEDLVPLAKRARTSILITCAVAFFIAALLAFWFSRLFSRPLGQLVRRSRDIANLDLKRVEVPSLSRITELRELSMAIEEMRISLAAHVEDRNRALAVLNEKETALRDLGEHSTDVIVRVDRNMRYIFVNSAYEHATGIPVQYVIGKPAGEVGFPEEVMERFNKHARLAIDEGKSSSLLFLFPTPRGPRYFESRVTPEHDEKGAVETILFISRDIHDRVVAEESLRVSEAKYRSLIESPIGGFVVWDGATVLFANRVAASLLGFSNTSDMVGAELPNDRVEESYREDLMKVSKAFLSGESEPTPSEWILVRPDGSRRWVQSRFSRIDWEGRMALQIFLSDTTEIHEAAQRQEQLEGQLLQAQKMEAVGLLAGGMAHDLNNILQVVGGNASLALFEGITDAERRIFIKEISMASNRAAVMIRQLLAFSRRQPLQKKLVDLNALVREHLVLVQRLFPENITVKFEPAMEPLVVKADPSQLEQVIMNLCVNARDAMSNGGSLTLRLEPRRLASDEVKHLKARHDSFASIKVRDTGTGMPPEVLDRAFEPYFTTKARDKGTGLGLSVAFGIMKQHEGDITAKSIPGQGTEFTLLLPLDQMILDLAEEKQEVAPVNKGSGSILLAEDSEQVLEFAQKILVRSGYSVVAVKDGEQAVRAFNEDPMAFDLLFFDVMMPVMGGPTAAEHCRLKRPDIPVIFASGYTWDSISSEAPLPANSVLLLKPFDTASMLVEIRKALAARKSA